MVEEDRSEVIEQGDIFFFYRPKSTRHDSFLILDR